ncbi:aspartyl protease family protein [Sphingomonas astaxanthinifaciens]|uniref:PDZ domain-containing protein n=1 Tax=Sphingomonas astaxanthinifaciens DSM 22298 TaxID=1123267 RepID=A0ABQ5Z540_9SPHN|nr:aspartyl protease family protein [Sphingomonas astaxanthinifaciens]GLR46486.1 hypothetical protein GCM10007925_01970 [Sphingomonas astaxanthinifaciens DSM 22298]
MQRRELLGLLGASGLCALVAPQVLTAQGTGVLVSRIALVGSRVIVAVTIDGSEPYPFLLDTGGFLSFIDDALAKSLKLSQRGMVDGSGVGGRATLPLYLARNVVFGGGLRQDTVAFAGMTSGFSAVRGALAAGVMTALDSDLDFEAGEWRLYPGGRATRSGFIRMAKGIDGGGGGRNGSPRLFGDAEVNGRTLRFLLDTGAPSGLSLTRNAARSLGLWTDERPYAPLRTSGIGGQGGIGRLVRSERIAFAGRTFERPVILLRDDNSGAGGRIDGVIGLDLLRGFNLSTDVKAGDVWLQPLAGFALADRYGLSGLWLDEKGGEVVVADVGTGSPAKQAGIAVGDRLVGGTLPEMVRRITGRPGTPVTLSVRRGGATRDVSFVLAEFL